MQELFAPIFDLLKIIKRSSLYRHFDFSIKNPIVMGAGLFVVLLLGFFAYWIASRGKRGIRKTLRDLKKHGKFREAGEIYFAQEQWPEALDCFLKAKVYSRAAKVHERIGNFAESGRLYEEASAIEDAVEVYRKGKMFDRASYLLKQVNRGHEAARLLDLEGQKNEAAKMHLEHRDFLEAARIFLEMRDFKAAGKAFLQEFDGQMSRIRTSVASTLTPELKEIAKKAAAAFLQAGDKQAAAEAYRKAEDFVRAAALFQESGDWRQAAESLGSAGRLEDAARLFMDHGEAQEAFRMRAVLYQKQGKDLEAAQCLMQAKEFLSAAEIWLKLENKKQAADCFREAGDFLEAASLYAGISDHAQAALSYEKANAFEEAARHCGHLGDKRKQTDLLLRAGRIFPAVELMVDQGQSEKAIALLQEIGADDADYRRACTLLGRLFFEKGILGVALKKLEEGIAGERIGLKNIEEYYVMAMILERNQDTARAAKVYEEILATQYNYRDVPDRLGKLQLELSQRESNLSATGNQPAAPDWNTASPSVATPQDRFELVEELGRGGMGIVYKARDRILNRVLALKYLPANFAKNALAIRNFQREAQSSAGLNHPGIVTVFDVGFDSRGNYIAMEYLEGKTLKNIVREKGPLAPQEIYRIGEEMALALQYAHENKVVHRDVKSSNMLWCANGKIKLMDFGLAKILQEARHSATQISGTPYYMSPEQTLGKALDHRTDIYSLGVSLYEMATGEVPFKEGDIGFHQVNTFPVSIREKNPKIPQNLNEIILRCLEKNPDGRFPSAAALAQSLQEGRTQWAAKPTP